MGQTECRRITILLRFYRRFFLQLQGIFFREKHWVTSADVAKTAVRLQVPGIGDNIGNVT